MNIISNVKGFSERGAIGYCNTVLYTFMCKNYSKTASIETSKLEEKIMEVEYDFVLAEYCRVFILMSEKKKVEPVK